MHRGSRLLEVIEGVKPSVVTTPRIPDIDSRWPIQCNRCQILVSPEDFVDHSTVKRVAYNTVSTRPEPGDLYYDLERHIPNDKNECDFGWENCDGRHLVAVLPNGITWDIMSRCSNCTLPNDTKHRCWVVQGDVPNITVDKNGVTCAAGAGSIAVPGYHGFLRNGEFTKG